MLLTTIFLALTSLALTAPSPATSNSQTPHLEAGWTLLNLTHVPTSPVPPRQNGSITFTLTAGTNHAAQNCTHTFTPTQPANGGPLDCNNDFPDLIYYWRESDVTGRDDKVVDLTIWFSYINCSPNGGAVSETGTLRLPVADRAPPPSNGSIGNRVWDEVYVPMQTAASTAFWPGQWEEMCPDEQM